MSHLSDLAFAQKAARARVQAKAQARVNMLWNTGTVHDLEASWSALAPAMVAQVVNAQVAVARQTAPYIAAVNNAYSKPPSPVTIAPEAFGGVMLDGREVGPAMYTAVTTAKTAIRGGMSTFTAFQTGAYALSVVVGNAIQDMARQADLTASLSSTYTRYVRVCDGSACSRCSILAGMGSAEEAFLRHVSCQCGTMPIEGHRKSGKETFKVPEGLFSSPDALFDSLSKEQQDHTFTKAGAEAIRAGADPVKVVNARRGAYGIGYSGHYNTPVKAGTHNTLQTVTIGKKPDGSPLQVFMTREGTTYRGEFGRNEVRTSGQSAKEGRYRRTTSIRLMPEQLVQMAGGNTERLNELLVRYGYAY